MVVACTRRRWLAALTVLMTAAVVLRASVAAAAPSLTHYSVHLGPHPQDGNKLRLEMELCYSDAQTGEQATIDARQLTEQVKLLSTGSPGITASQGKLTDLIYRVIKPWPDEHEGRQTGALRFVIPPARTGGCSQVKVVFEHEPGPLSYTWTQRFITLEHAYHLDPPAPSLELSVDVPTGTKAPPGYRCEPHGKGQRCRARFDYREPVLVPLGPIPMSSLEMAGLTVLVLLLVSVWVHGAQRERKRERWRRAPAPPESPPPQVATYRKAPPSEEAASSPDHGVIAMMGKALRRYSPIVIALVACVGPALAVVPMRLDQRPQLAFALALWPAITFARVVLGHGRSVAHLVWPALLVALAWSQPSVGIIVGLIVLVPTTGIAFLMQGGARSEH